MLTQSQRPEEDAVRLMRASVSVLRHENAAGTAALGCPFNERSSQREGRLSSHILLLMVSLQAVAHVMSRDFGFSGNPEADMVR